MEIALEAPFELEALRWRGDAPEFLRDVRAALDNKKGVLVHEFPLDEDSLVAFVSRFGTPLLNYNKKSGIEAGASRNPYVNLVKLKRETGERNLLHGKGGPLAIHTARSWLQPRPKLFALLMVHAGWRGNTGGENGESLFIAFSKVLATMADDDPERFRQVFSILKNQPVRFEADNVRESVADLPIVYPLADSRDDLDMGVRLKQDLVKKLTLAELFGADVASLQAAISWLQETANRLAQKNRMVMQAGDLVIIDNNRWGHGRCGYIGAREIDGQFQLSQREVWSLALA
jgi:alpha-ketoglutarate-dependent taurine dioxygenase